MNPPLLVLKVVYLQAEAGYGADTPCVHCLMSRGSPVILTLPLLFLRIFDTQWKSAYQSREKLERSEN